MKNDEITITCDRYRSLLEFERVFIKFFEELMESKKISILLKGEVDNIELSKKLNLYSEKFNIKVSVSQNMQIYYWDYNNTQRIIR